MNLARFGSLLARSRPGAALRFISAGHRPEGLRTSGRKTEGTVDYINAKLDDLESKIKNQAELNLQVIESVRRDIKYLHEGLSRTNDQIRYHEDDLNRRPLKYEEKINFGQVAENFYGWVGFLCLLMTPFFLFFFIFSSPVNKQEAKKASEWS